MLMSTNINFAKNKLNSSNAINHPDIIETVEYLEKVEKNLHHSKNLTQQLLTFSRGNLPMCKTAPIQELLKEAAYFSLSGSNINCKFYIPEDLSPVIIDQGQIFQVISNIIINARQAVENNGTIKICAKNITIDKDKDNNLPLDEGNYVKISIQDNGTGISPGYLEKIFTPFFSTKKEGSGLGLTTCYSIIVKHSGYITVESEPGEGTTFHIYLKASHAYYDQGLELENTTSIKDKISYEQDEQKSITSKKEKKALVMDDHQMIREMLYEILDSKGYEVECAKNSEEALNLIRNSSQATKPFYIAILDVNVPGEYNGKEISKKLKKINPETKTVLITGYSLEEVYGSYYNYNDHNFSFDEVITKPFDIEKIKDTLDK